LGGPLVVRVNLQSAAVGDDGLVDLCGLLKQYAEVAEHFEVVWVGGEDNSTVVYCLVGLAGVSESEGESAMGDNVAGLKAERAGVSANGQVEFALVGQCQAERT